MAVPLKLGTIEQQHLQELFDAAHVMRDDLPYSPALAQVCRDFQDRTFKNASEAQVYGALLKYVRTGRRQKGAQSTAPAALPDCVRHATLLRAQRRSMLKLQPYSPDFEFARAAFARNGGTDLSPAEFWRVVRLAATPENGRFSHLRAVHSSPTNGGGDASVAPTEVSDPEGLRQSMSGPFKTPEADGNTTAGSRTSNA